MRPHCAAPPRCVRIARRRRESSDASRPRRGRGVAALRPSPRLVRRRDPVSQVPRDARDLRILHLSALTLPVELFANVGAYLPAVALARLDLTSRAVHAVVGMHEDAIEDPALFWVPKLQDEFRTAIKAADPARAHELDQVLARADRRAFSYSAWVARGCAVHRTQLEKWRREGQ